MSVKEAIKNGDFEDGERMEKLDVIFANRYLKAYDSYMNNNEASSSWIFAFDQTKQYWPIVLQHLLLGMNAHINLDLGIAAAQVSRGKDINALENDFNKINSILASLVEEVENGLASIWPTLHKILRWTSKFDDFLVNFSMNAARDAAWSFACALSELSVDEQNALIIEQDEKVTKAAHLIRSPGIVVSGIFKIIRIGERGSIATKTRALNDQF